MAQVPVPAPSIDVGLRVDSGWVGFDAKRPVDGPNGTQVVYSTVVRTAGAPWLRLKLADVVLAGEVENGNAAFLRITSPLDGGVQLMTQEHVKQWNETSAYFNGDQVLVEVLAHPTTPASRVRIVAATAGMIPTTPVLDSICGPNDDRVLSNDPRQARHSVGCTSWMINDVNNQFLTAGHCGAAAGSVMSFNVPLSTSTGALVASAPQDQYPTDAASTQGNGGVGIGNDYAYFGVFPNSNTGLMPAQVNGGQFYTLQLPPVLAAGQVIRITGYGTTSAPVTPTWNQVQKTHTGARIAPTTGLLDSTLEYYPDTTGGNSGSPVILDSVGGNIAIGIHTHAGCVNPQGVNGNRGTSLSLPALQAVLAAPLSACVTGRGTPGGALYAIGDAVNNFGTVSTSSGGFAKVSFGPARMQGLTYDWNNDVFYGVNNDTFTGTQRLFSITPAGVATLIAPLAGASGVVTGLGYNPATNSLYGIVQATGQLVFINRSTGVTTNIGAANAGTQIGGLEFNPRNNTLYGIDDSNGGRLVSIAVGTGAITVIGATGIAGADCNGLAVTDDGFLWTINATTEQLLRINPTTGAATVVGPTGGLFGAGFGMAARLTRPAPACYANCDQSTTPPVLNAGDFTCFLSQFRADGSLPLAGQIAAYSNCDQSTTAPVLNAGDFTCFLNRFRAGCP
jgi:hypothetical protein